MNGTIVEFDLDTQQGVIEAEDQARYPFSLAQWRSGGLPDVGMAVSANLDQGRLSGIIRQPIGQQRAVGHTTSADEAPRQHTHNVSIVAFVLLILGIPFGWVVLLPVPPLAVWALWQLRQNPERYTGTSRLLAWAALVVSLLLLGLTLSVDPQQVSPPQ